MSWRRNSYSYGHSKKISISLPLQGLIFPGDTEIDFYDSRLRRIYDWTMVIFTHHIGRSPFFIAYIRIPFQYLRPSLFAILLRRRGSLFYFYFLRDSRLTTLTCNSFWVGVRFSYFCRRLCKHILALLSGLPSTITSGGRFWWTLSTCAWYLSDMPTSSCKSDCKCKFYLLLTALLHCIVCYSH